MINNEQAHGGDSIEVRKRGYELIRDPLLNKGTAFTQEERDLFGISGMLPPAVNTMEQQAERAFASIQNIESDIGKYLRCASLQDHNEQLFYRVLGEHIEELMPIVYTPTVGVATQDFSHVFQRGRGIWLTPDMQGHLQGVLERALDSRPVSLIVATDSESILGIGDQGAGGMAISVGKLALYVAGAGIDPSSVLPVCLDVGTNNEELLADELYLGWRAPRMKGASYDEFIDEFVNAVRATCPHALLQWEDFRKDNALKILNRYRTNLLSFNDDIQGTGAVTLAGVLTGLRLKGESLQDQRILIHGAGAAGLGIARQLKSALLETGLGEEHFPNHVAVLDSRGLLLRNEQVAPDQQYKREIAWPLSRAEDFGLAERESRNLAGVVKRFKPTVLIGSSGQAGAFSEEIIQTILTYCERPLIFPFSNPTSSSEATPEDLLTWSNGACLVATGSPFPNVTVDGKTYEIGQGNNVFIFPGLGLGALAAQATEVSDAMVSAASSALAESVAETELARGLLFPEIGRLREVSRAIARAVAISAVNSGIATAEMSKIERNLSRMDWWPSYKPYTLS